jgi:hypothetical protein
VPVQRCILPYGLYRAAVPVQWCTYRTACTEPQCLYKDALTVRPVQSLSVCTRVHFTFTFYLYMIKVITDVNVALLCLYFIILIIQQIRTTLNSLNTAWPIEWQEIYLPVRHFPGPNHSFLVFWSQLFAARVLIVRDQFRI